MAVGDEARVAPGAVRGRHRPASGSSIGAGARVRGTVLGAGAHIGAGATVTGCVLGAGARVPDGVSLSDAKVGTDEVAGPA